LPLGFEILELAGYRLECCNDGSMLRP